MQNRFEVPCIACYKVALKFLEMDVINNIASRTSWKIPEMDVTT